VPVPFPDRPPFRLRARLLSPLADGSLLWEPDGVVEVDAAGRLAFVGPAANRLAGAKTVADANANAVADGSVAPGAERGALIDVRPLVVMPGLVDTHVHLPQVPAAGLGAGMDLLAWLERYVFPLERDFDVAAAERLAPQVYRAMAAAGTTTFAGYGAIWADSLDACFRAAEAHGIRAVLGKVMMDRLSYDGRLEREQRREVSLRQSAELCERWHGAAGGLLRYAFTPRFAVSCSAELLRESAALASAYGATWQTHVSEDRREMATVAELFPEARDYLDVYDRAGGLGPHALLAHAIHLSDREVARLVETGSAVAHCPVSNMFIRSGIMPLARYRAEGIRIGLGTDVAGAPELSLITQMRDGFYQQNARHTLDPDGPPPPGPLDWLRLGTLGGAQALGLAEIIGSLEMGKEADLIALDAEAGRPPGAGDAGDVEEVASRLIFRERLGMVRAAWVRGRRLAMEQGHLPGD
jgi:guanine deaminase